MLLMLELYFDIVFMGILNHYFECAHYNAIGVNLKKIKNDT